MASANKVHRKVLREIDDLLEEVDLNAGDPRIAHVLKSVTGFLAPIREKLEQQIDALERCARWDIFTIALYGETNAGKSTIIETLRILLGERTKVEERAEFRACQSEYGLTETELSALDRSIDEGRARQAACAAQAAGSIARIEARELAHADELARLRHLAATNRASEGFLQSLLRKIRGLQEATELEHALRQRDALVERHAAECERLAALCAGAQDEVLALEAQRARATAALEKLALRADGRIVGNGRSDFTAETRSYEFEGQSGRRFVLLDVPGIEGQEHAVMSSILEAIRAAHVVFYVTGKAAPPQTGDRPGQQGTLEKVRAHLGDQTEVWSIYNKRVTNALAFDTTSLLSPGEKDGLKVLDDKMRERLGEQRYRGCIPLSAHPAFLAVADCLSPDSNWARNRAKFLARASRDELLVKSAFDEFARRLSTDMAGDCSSRMRVANVNKVRCAVQQAIDEIEQMQRDHTGPLAEEIRKDWQHVGHQLELSADEFADALRTGADAAVRRFESQVRQRAYARIEQGVARAELVSAVAADIRDEQAAFESTLSRQIETRFEVLRNSVAGILERFKDRVARLEDAYRPIDGLDSRNPEFSLAAGRGRKIAPIVASVVGLVVIVASLGTAGTVEAVIVIMGAVLSLAKLVRAAFDGQYRRAQQRKAVDAHVQRIGEHLREAARLNVDNVCRDVAARMGDIAAAAGQCVEQAEQVNSALIRARASLAGLFTTLHEKEVA